MASIRYSEVIKSSGKRSLQNLGKRIRKLHQNYDAQIRKAKSKAKLRQIYLKHRKDHQKLLQQHLKEEGITIKRLGKVLEKG